MRRIPLILRIRKVIEREPGFSNLVAFYAIFIMSIALRRYCLEVHVPRLVIYIYLLCGTLDSVRVLCVRKAHSGLDSTGQTDLDCRIYMITYVSGVKP